MDNLLIREGVTHRDPLSVVLYGLSLFVMAEQIWMDFPGFLQSWYADEFIMKVTGTNIMPSILRIGELGPVRGFYLKS